MHLRLDLGKAKGALEVRVPMKVSMATLDGAGCGDDGNLDRERLLGEAEFEVVLIRGLPRELLR